MVGFRTIKSKNREKIDIFIPQNWGTPISEPKSDIRTNPFQPWTLYNELTVIIKAINDIIAEPELL